MFLCYLRKVHRKPETKNSVSEASFLTHVRNVPETLVATKYWCYKEKYLCSNQPCQQSTWANNHGGSGPYATWHFTTASIMFAKS